jgi:5-methylcytosine-specific restriction endonuclease McrA
VQVIRKKRVNGEDEMEQRSKGYVQITTPEIIERLQNGKCPTCGLFKSEWKRRKDWTCCSKKCSEAYQQTFHSWQIFKHIAFKRDKYTCVKCGFICPKDKYPKYPRELDEKGELVYEYSENYNTREIVADHIMPIAIGGEEYDINNIQTLCLKCNKFKTKKDMQKIANFRKAERNKQNRPLVVSK